ncbi:hypothetical protein T492DRAFT_901788 [Pavlovales sp. CCMP2436]|nr:hypothetical protein T492DRAFT_901788 [Pavlovales sp. CCMP2436]
MSVASSAARRPRLQDPAAVWRGLRLELARGWVGELDPPPPRDVSAAFPFLRPLSDAGVLGAVSNETIVDVSDDSLWCARHLLTAVLTATAAWRGVEFSRSLAPEWVLDQISAEAGSGARVHYVDADGNPAVAEPTDGDEPGWVVGWTAAERQAARTRTLHRLAQRRAKRRVLTRAALFGALSALCTLPAARALSLSAARGAFVLCARHWARASLLTYGVAGPLLLLGLLLRRDIWLREQRDALPLLLLDCSLLRLGGNVVDCMLGLATAAGAAATSLAPAVAAVGVGVAAAPMEGAPLGVRWVQPLLVIVRELLALSALWWWTDLTAIVRDGKGRFGKPTIAALLVTASPALSLAATSAGAGFPALLVQRVLGSPPLLALGARLGKDALALWALNGAELALETMLAS